MSAVWKHFKVSEKDGRMAVCRQCSAELSRGGTSGKTYSTTSLIYHLKSRHPEQYAEYEKDTGAAAAAKRKVPPSTPTPSVADFSEKAKKFAKNSAKAKGITKMIMEFIALDDQPFSVVEDVGFRRLIEYIEPRYTMPSRRYFSDVCLPEMYNVVSTRVHGLLATDIAAFSFTTDIWSSDVSPTSMLSLTAQWIDTDFKLQKVVLHSQEFRGSHTAEAISEAFTNMFDTWRIDRSKVHAVVSDDTRNMAKAMEDSDLKGIRCMAHTIQLAVNEGVMSQCSIADVIAIGRKIVGHFKHSPLAYARLQSIQEQFAMPPKRLQQDVSTRWSSTYYMLESLFAQKRVLAAYIADYDLPATFTAHQWVLIQNVLSLLAPFEQLTKEISSSEASVADVIPFLAALKRLLNKEAETDHRVKTTKSALFEAVNTRFSQAASEPLYCIATVLDPRYKEHYLDVGTKQRTREMIQAELDLGKPLGDGDGQGTHGAGDGGDSAERKMSRTDEPRTASLSDMFDEILQENNTNARPRRSSTAQQLDDYLSEVPIPRSNNPLEYWRTDQGRFPDLAQMARRYLSAPCTSTDSERLFSAASHVLDEKSNQLECGKAEKLLFIKKNLTLFLKKLNVKSTETGSSAPTCDQTVSLQKVTRGDSKDASVSRGARVLRVAEEPEPQMFSTVDVKRRTMGSGIQCPYCRYRCGSKFSFQIHVGSQHPLHCEDVSVGRLGKVVFYQRTAKLFHCHICFYTSKDYAVLFEHLLARHCFSVRKAVQTDKGDEVTDKDDTEVREQDRSPNPEIKPDNDNTTEQHDHETSNADSLKRKRSSGSRGEDGDEDTNVPDIQAANEEQTSAVEQFSECSIAPYYDCKFCKQRCKSKDSLLRHISCKHDIPKPHACKECSDTFMLESLLSHHVNLHHRQKLYQCPYCLFESSLQGLHQHLSQCRAVERNEDKGDVGTEEKE